MNAVDAVCPKRLWVMLTLSDDEQIEPGTELPKGLRFHLSRCPACRTLADQLLSTTDLLAAVSAGEPAPQLAGDASRRAMEALSAGSQMTGRVVVPDEPLESAIPVGSSPQSGTWRLRLATAAAIGLAVTWFGMSALRNAQRDSSTPPYPPMGFSQDGLVRSDPDTHQPSEVVESADPDEGAVAESSTDPSSNNPARSDSSQPAPSSRTTARRIRHHHSHLEAAMNDDPQGAQAAVVLPDRSTRELGWLKLFDRSSRVRSTKPVKDEP